jgi:hypothetical protein
MGAWCRAGMVCAADVVVRREVRGGLLCFTPSTRTRQQPGAGRSGRVRGCGRRGPERLCWMRCVCE